MCNFLSALYLQTDELVCFPAVTDSHEVLIAYLRMRDDTRRGFVRVEFIPPSDVSTITDPGSWVYSLDEGERPDWYDEHAEERCRVALIDVVRRIVEQPNLGSTLIGECRVLVNGRIYAHGCRIFAYGSSVVATYSSSVEAYDSSRIEAYDSSNVKAYDSSNVEAYSHSSVIEAYDRSNVKAYRSSSVKAYGNSNVEAYGCSRIEAYGSSSVEAYGSSSVMAYDSSRIEANGCSRIEAYSHSSVKAYGNKVTICDMRLP